MYNVVVNIVVIIPLKNMEIVAGQTTKSSSSDKGRKMHSKIYTVNT